MFRKLRFQNCGFQRRIRYLERAVLAPAHNQPAVSRPRHLGQSRARNRDTSATRQQHVSNTSATRQTCGCRGIKRCKTSPRFSAPRFSPLGRARFPSVRTPTAPPREGRLWM
eukprot:4143362-Pyramimonas_sp.AAC.1